MLFSCDYRVRKFKVLLAAARYILSEEFRIFLPDENIEVSIQRYYKFIKCTQIYTKRLIRPEL